MLSRTRNTLALATTWSQAHQDRTSSPLRAPRVSPPSSTGVNPTTLTPATSHLPQFTPKTPQLHRDDLHPVPQLLPLLLLRLSPRVQGDERLLLLPLPTDLRFPPHQLNLLHSNPRHHSDLSHHSHQHRPSLSYRQNQPFSHQWLVVDLRTATLLPRR